MRLHERFGRLAWRGVFFAHLGQRLVQRLDREIDLAEKLGNLRVLLLERGGDADRQLRRQRAGRLRIGIVGVGEGLPGFGIERRFFQLDQLEAAEQRRRRPVIEQDRFASTNRGTDLGIQRRPGPAAEVHVTVVQPVGLELLLVDHLGRPADRAVEKAALARRFRIAEHVLVPGQIGDAAQVRGHGLDALGRVTLDHILGHPPAFGGTLDRVAQAHHLAFSLGLDPDRTAPGPFFADHLDIVVGQRGFQGNGRARQGIGGQSVTLLDDDPQDIGDQAAAFPIQVGKMDGRLGGGHRAG